MPHLTTSLEQGSLTAFFDPMQQLYAVLRLAAASEQICLSRAAKEADLTAGDAWPRNLLLPKPVS